MTKQKRPHAQVMTVAAALVDRLSPACIRIEIAGSLRRQCAEVGDIEIVAIPRLHVDMFGEPTDRTHVDDLLATWPVELAKNGAKYKQFTLTTNSGSEYQVDLFLQPDPATWGVNFMIRTGSGEFSKRMVTPKRLGGYMPDGFRVQDARVWNGPTVLPTPEERDVFDLWGMAFVEPCDRNGGR